MILEMIENVAVHGLSNIDDSDISNISEYHFMCLEIVKCNGISLNSFVSNNGENHQCRTLGHTRVLANSYSLASQ